MPEFGYAFGGQPVLDELARTDLLLDALAERRDVDFDDPKDFHDQALAALLGDWRDDLRWPPASALVSQEEVAEALRSGIAERQAPRRSMAAVGSVAATLLLLSGFGAVVADARPGDLLYGLHAMMFDEPRVSDDQIELSAKAELAKVEQMIAQGQWDQAQTQLAEVSSTLQAVNDGSRRQTLMNEINQLNTKVEKRDPNATLRPPSDPPAATAPASTPTSTPPTTTSPTSPTTTSPSPSQSTSPTRSTTQTPTTNPTTTKPPKTKHNKTTLSSAAPSSAANSP